MSISLLTLAAWAPARAWAARYTPAVWRQEVPAIPPTPFSGQRKNISWIRDRNGDFIDDALPRGLDSVHVVLELNDCYQPDYLRRRFARFGRISYIGRLVSCLYLQDVLATRLDSLALMPEVAMVEWQTPFRPIMGVSVRGVQAAKSDTYGDEYARTWGDAGWSGTTGSGVNIAILDTGVRNDHDTLPGASSAAGTVVAGFDATDPADPADGTTDPSVAEPLLEHGTRVASIALGRKPEGTDCGWTDSDGVAPDCAGVAPEAGLVDVKVWARDSWAALGTDRLENDPNIMRGIDWVGIHHDDVPIHVVNISLSDGIECDGLCAACEAVNYLAAIGVTPVVGHGNAKAGTSAGARRLMPSVAAASYAITVAGVNDHNTVTRTDDTEFTDYLEGPRYTKTGADTGPLGQKPDLAAPAENIVSLDYESKYSENSGTSYAAPHVAGAAAILLQADPALGPADVKDVLRRTADSSRNASGAGTWDTKFGAGILNVYDALHATKVTDLRFASCVEPWATSGKPCTLAGGLPRWLNTIDLTTDPDPPEENEPTTVKAAIYNDGSAAATDFLVTFGYYEFGTGAALFHEIETVRVERLDAYGDTEVECTWTPRGSGHQCLQVSIQYGFDSEFGNNTTQRNLTVEASRYDVRVENPFMKPAQFYVQAASETPGWPCTVSEPQFTIGGPEDCPKTIEVGFRAPQDAGVGARANCNVSVFARPLGAVDSVLVGGVTVQTFVPGDCRIIGRVFGPSGRGIDRARLTFLRDIPPGALRASWERERHVRTDRDGVFDLVMPAGAHHSLRIAVQGVGEWTIPVRTRCGVGTLKIQLGPEGPKIIH